MNAHVYVCFAFEIQMFSHLFVFQSNTAKARSALIQNSNLLTTGSLFPLLFQAFHSLSSSKFFHSLSSSKFDDDDIRYEEDTPGVTSAGCAGIALDMMTGAAAGSFCLGPRLWSKRG